MNWTESIFIAGCMVGTFTAGVLVENQRGGGLMVREVKTNSSSGKLESHEPKSKYDSHEKPAFESRCSATAAACDIGLANDDRMVRGQSVSCEQVGQNSKPIHCCRSAHGAANDAQPKSVSAKERALKVDGQGPCSHEAIFTALSLVWRAESSCGQNFGPSDGGKAYGHFGQHVGPREHWEMGCKALGVDWPESDRTNLARAAAVVAANWSIFAPQALKDGNVEMLIRVHRLPSAPYRADNDVYVSRVLKGE